MRLILAVILTGAVLTPATPVAPATAATEPPATYLLHIPPGPTHTRPLVLLLPASGWTAQQFQDTTAATAFGDTRDVVVATVDPQAGRWNAGRCCLQPGTVTHRDDVAAVRWVAADATGRTAVDPRRVYVVGGSGGGMMAWRVVCEAPQVFAAAGVVAGSLMTSCGRTPARVVRVHGGADGTVPYGGGPGFEGHVFPSLWGVGVQCPVCTVLPTVLPGWPHRWPPSAWDLMWPNLQKWTL